MTVGATNTPQARADVIGLGEVMLRLDPGESRIRSARSFNVWEGGGEYNAIRALTRTFGLRTAFVTALVDNDVGRLVESLMLAGGVNVELVRWVESDGVGRTVRNGLNFVERGFGIRGGKGVSDRGHTAISQIRQDDYDWAALFSDSQARWFHTGGIYAGLSEASAGTALRALGAAKSSGLTTSVDLNFRPSLWTGPGGVARAKDVFRQLAGGTDLLIGGESDFVERLSLVSPATSQPDSRFTAIAEQLLERFPNLQTVASTVRVVHSASRNDWGVLAYSRQEGFARSRLWKQLEVMDRVGGGDAVAAGLIHQALEGRPLSEAVEIAAAHGALAMTTPGDNSMATFDEVRDLATGGDARTSR